VDLDLGLILVSDQELSSVPPLVSDVVLEPLVARDLGENLGLAGEGSSANLLRREKEVAHSLAADVGSGSLSGSSANLVPSASVSPSECSGLSKHHVFSPKPSGSIDFSEGSVTVSVSDLPVPESQPLVNGLTEAQAWFFGWMRHHENLLAAVDRFEEQTQRDNEVAPPPDCSMELPQMKA
jgi:hypothetical protein